MDEAQMKLKLRILEAREKRVQMIKEAITSERVILSLRANYPGDYKDQLVTRSLVSEMNRYLEQYFDIISSIYQNCGEGPVYIYQLNSVDAIKVKREAIEIEHQHPLGRLVDLDVYYKTEKSLSRQDLDFKARSCFLCEEDAFYCIKSKRHTVDELISHIHRVVNQYEQRKFMS